MLVLHLDVEELWFDDDVLTPDELFWLECFLNG